MRRLVVVSIIGIDEFAGGYNAAKVAQEQAALAGPIPARIVRAAQFHEFVEELMRWGTQGDVSYVWKMRTQLVSARTVAEALVELATAPDPEFDAAETTEIAGPREGVSPMRRACWSRVAAGASGSRSGAIPPTPTASATRTGPSCPDRTPRSPARPSRSGWTRRSPPAGLELPGIPRGAVTDVLSMIVNLMVRRCADRLGEFCGPAPRGGGLRAGPRRCPAAADPRGRAVRDLALGSPRPCRRQPSGSTYTLMQMNLCLSGFAGCYGKVAYPAGVEEAGERIRDAHPDAVTLNEGCQRDVARIARRTGYHLRFSGVIYRGERLPCADRPAADSSVTRCSPRQRSRAPTATTSRRSPASSGADGCASPPESTSTCAPPTWATRSPIDVAGNDAQCVELAVLLARRAVARTVIFGGDVNRRPSCAPARPWTRTDASANQAPGLQHVYGSGALRSPSAEVVRSTQTDHDALRVRAHLTAPE